MKKVYVPGSKSITNRALVLAALSNSPVVLHNVLDSDDSRYMQAALRQLGVHIESVGRNSLRVVPPAELLAVGDELFIGNAGTAARFLGALSLVVEGAYTLSGVERMHQRPQADLMQALRSLDVKVDCLGQAGFLPAKFLSAYRSSGTSERQKVELSGKASSQFLSGLMLVAPRLPQGLEIRITDGIPSRPYVEMTLALLELWGAEVEASDDFLNFKIAPGFVAPAEYHIPSDMSSASYPLAWSVLRGVPISIENFGTHTLQGDEQFLEVIKATGAKVTRSGAKLQVEPKFDLQPIGDWNYEPMPDVSMTGMVLAAFCPGVSRFTGLESLRVKECDRILAMEQLAHLGVGIEVAGDVMTVTGGASLKIMGDKVVINSYDDHRIAMCFGVLKAAIDLGADPHQESLISITQPECVGKTWPDFWLALADWENQLRPVAAVVLQRIIGRSEDGKQGAREYLIVKKPRKDNAWQFPQGGIDEGETGRQAAARELAEECGADLNVKLKGERSIGQYAYAFPKDFLRWSEAQGSSSPLCPSGISPSGGELKRKTHFIGAKVDFFAADYVSGEVEVDGEEIVDYAWVTAENLEDYFSPVYLQTVREFL